MAHRKICPTCGKQFECDAANTDGCWCAAFPPLFSPDEPGDCLCPVCLKKAIIRKIDEYTATITQQNARDNIAQKLPKTGKLVEDIDYYMEGGYMVFTKWYHLKRGFCCGSGCRHCPYRG